MKFDEQNTLFLAKIFKFHEHVIVCTKLESWEKHTIDCQGKINVAESRASCSKERLALSSLFTCLP